MSNNRMATAPKRTGNYKAGPGRPPGSKNKKTLALEEATRKVVATIDGAFDGDAHAFLQAVYKNPDVPPPLEIRIQAASRALRVEKPTLSASHSSHNINVGLADRMERARLRVINAKAIDDNKCPDRVSSDHPI